MSILFRIVMNGKLENNSYYLAEIPSDISFMKCPFANIISLDS